MPDEVGQIRGDSLLHCCEIPFRFSVDSRSPPQAPPEAPAGGEFFLVILHLFALEIHISPRRGHVRLRGDQEPELMSDVHTIKPHRYCRSQALLDQSVSADVYVPTRFLGFEALELTILGLEGGFEEISASPS